MTSYTACKWWGPATVAVVTGANKGIGFEIAHILADQGIHTIVTARNEQLGVEAAEKIKQAAGQDARVDFHALDISKPESIAAFADWLKEQHGGLSILVNNAGIAYKGDVFGADEAEATLQTNYYGTANLCEALVPAMKSGGRIVNVSSRAGLTSIIRDPKLLARFTDAASRQEIDAACEDFVAAIRAGNCQEQGWPKSMYGLSKLAVTAYTRMLARQLQPSGIMVNACCPNYCVTDMTSGKGIQSAAAGADTPVWLALKPPVEFTTGGFYGERHELVW